MLVNTVSCGGNLLMNVGPTSRGYIDYRAEEALKVYADWMKYNSRSIYGCTMAEPEFKAPADCRFTQSEDGKRLYLHIFAYPFRHIQLHGLVGKIDYAQFLHDGSEVKYTEKKMQHFGESLPEADDLVVLEIPPVKPHTLVPGHRNLPEVKMNGTGSRRRASAGTRLFYRIVISLLIFLV